MKNDTEKIMLAEDYIKNYSGEYKISDLFNKLHSEVSRKKFYDVLGFLIDNNKVGIDNKGYVVYFWNPEQEIYKPETLLGNYFWNSFLFLLWISFFFYFVKYYF